MLARRHQLHIIAITDHDTTAGVGEAQAAANGSPVLIPGIELSAADDDGADVHMLGYYVRVEDAEFQARLTTFQHNRVMRAERMVARLAELGMPLEWSAVLQQVKGGTVGRPHVARALVAAGYLESTDEAFRHYLYTGGPAYITRDRFSPEEAIALIHSAGGAAVLAHPALVKNYGAMVERLVPAGLDGVEVMHPKNTADIRANLRALAQKYNLVISGGSDFHRPYDPIGSESPPEGSAGELRRRGEHWRV